MSKFIIVLNLKPSFMNSYFYGSIHTILIKYRGGRGPSLSDDSLEN